MTSDRFRSPARTPTQWRPNALRRLAAIAFGISTLLFGFAMAQTSPAPRGVDVVMIGDSITWGGKFESRFPNIRLVNRAIPGYTTDDVLDDMQDTIALRPRKAVLMIGINDLLQRKPVQDTYERYVSIVRKLQAAGIPLVMMATLECSIRTCVEAVAWVRELNSKLRAFALAEHIPFIDLNPKITDAKTGLLPAYTWDGLHLLEPAYGIWVREIKSYLK